MERRGLRTQQYWTALLELALRGLWVARRPRSANPLCPVLAEPGQALWLRPVRPHLVSGSDLRTPCTGLLPWPLRSQRTDPESLARRPAAVVHSVFKEGRERHKTGLDNAADQLNTLCQVEQARCITSAYWMGTVVHRSYKNCHGAQERGMTRSGWSVGICWLKSPLSCPRAHVSQPEWPRIDEGNSTSPWGSAPLPQYLHSSHPLA